MSSIAIVTLIAVAAPVWASIGATLTGQGVTDIFGNSFGVPGINATYDYVIVGGGNAGNAIAARLALDPANYSIAVIEAGSFYEILSGNLTQVPGYNFLTANPTNVGTSIASLTALMLETQPQPGYNNRTLGYITGQTFGGGSAANYMGYGRATIGTFDLWSDLVKDDFWAWENVYDFYKKSVHFTPPDYTKIDPSLNITYDPDAYSNNGGPLEVSYGGFQGPFGPALEESLDRLGFEAIDGFNSGKLIGYGTITGAIDPITATRSSSETSFLQAAAKKPGLKIYPNALAQKILFDKDKKATGVLVQGNSQLIKLQYEISARKEVIISAGVWQSPHLLIVSGVGPAETLRQHNIDVIADLPGVGQNEWDQPYMSLIYKVNVTTNTQIVAENPAALAEAEDLYLNHQAGRLSGFGAGQALGFEKFSQPARDQFSNSTLAHLATFPSDWPEVQYLPLESSKIPDDIGPDDNYLLLGTVLFATSSRGNMTISSSDMVDPPIINPNWLHDVGDQEQAVAALKRVREIAFNSSIVESEWIPGPDISTDEEILNWVQENMGLIYHGSSTCKMGVKSDAAAVVDSRARVYGVTGLRVVDASAFPLLPPGYPMASVYMFAEAIADSILNGN